MLIYGAFDNSFQKAFSPQTFTIDVDAKDSIENLKILITLQYKELMLEDFDILNAQRQRLKDDEKCQSLFIPGMDIIQIFIASSIRVSCCHIM